MDFLQHLMLLLILMLQHTTPIDTINSTVCAVSSEQGRKTPLSGVAVHCFTNDNDIPTANQLLTTDNTGCATLHLPDDGRSTTCRATFEDRSSLFGPAYTRVNKPHPQTATASSLLTFYPDRVQRGDPGFYNGCGPASSNSIAQFFLTTISGFERQCNNHDLCYDACHETREQCDVEFLHLMLNECERRQQSILICKALAHVFYWAVSSSLGDKAFEESHAKMQCGGTAEGKLTRTTAPSRVCPPLLFSKQDICF